MSRAPSWEQIKVQAWRYGVEAPRNLVKSIAGTAMYGSVPMSRVQRAAYVAEQRHDIHGWNGPGAFNLLEAIADYQIARGICGAVAEIGVHHGQYFLFLMMLLRRDERAVAMDLFEDQHLNIDNSGRGDRDLFIDNVRRFYPEKKAHLAVRPGDSQTVRSGEIEGLAQAPVRIFSVDGGHWRSIVVNDLYVAADALHEAGVVVLDDVFNMYFPGVAEGLAEYIHGPTPERVAGFRNANNRLKPFAIGCNKVLLCFEAQREAYRQMLLNGPIAKNIANTAIGWGLEGIPVFEL